MEIWKPIPGYEAYYEVSNQGKVRSIDRLVNNRYGTKCLRKGRILSPKKEGDGYIRVTLTVNSKKKTLQLHRLMALAFIPNPDSKPHINHINGIKDDNRLINLEWCTAHENMRHSHEKLPRKNRKLTAEQVREIRKLDSEGNLKPTEIAQKFGIHYNYVWDIRVGRKWKWLK